MAHLPNRGVLVPILTPFNDGKLERVADAGNDLGLRSMIRRRLPDLVSEPLQRAIDRLPTLQTLREPIEATFEPEAHEPTRFRSRRRICRGRCGV